MYFRSIIKPSLFSIAFLVFMLLSANWLDEATPFQQALEQPASFDTEWVQLEILNINEDRVLTFQTNPFVKIGSKTSHFSFKYWLTYSNQQIRLAFQYPKHSRYNPLSTPERRFFQKKQFPSTEEDIGSQV